MPSPAGQRGDNPSILDSVLDAIGRRVNFDWGWADASESTSLVRAGNRVVPNRIDVNFPGIDGQPALVMELGVIDGVPQCRKLSLIAHEGERPVRSADLDSIRLNGWVDDAYSAFAIEVSPNGVGQKLSGGPAAAKQAMAAATEFQRARRGKGKRAITPQLIEDAAKIYRDNFKKSPIQAVAAAYGVSERTASGWITLARREYGFLPTTDRGKKKVEFDD